MKSKELKILFEKICDYSIPSIQIVGSKGKGTTAFLLSNLLIRRDLKIGLFSSPYILDSKESIQINGVQISKKDWDDLCKKVPKELSDFEKQTFIALLYFQKNNCDYAILEAGLGGKNDATNIVNSCILNILTHIELEHCEILGNSFEEIVNEKMGIYKNGADFIFSKKQIQEVFTYVKKHNIKVDFSKNIKCGNWHPESFGLAIKALEFLGCKKNSADLEFLSDLSLPGRFELLEFKNRKIILDVAHTIDSVKFVMKKINNFSSVNESYSKIYFIHFLKDKSKKLPLKFKNKNAYWIKINDERAGEKPNFLKEISIEEAFNMIQKSDKGTLFSFVGSFKLVAEFKRTFKASSSKI